MRKLVLVGIALFAVGSFGAAQAAHGKATAKTAVCHKTSSTEKPYMRVVVTGAALKKAIASSDDIVPAPKSCPTDAADRHRRRRRDRREHARHRRAARPRRPRRHRHRRDPAAGGQARVCFRFDVQNIGTAAAAHIHKGGPEASGPVVVPLGRRPRARRPAASRRRASSSRTSSPTGGLLRQRPHGRLPGGAVRGQLAPVAGIALFRSEMLGAEREAEPGRPERHRHRASSSSTPTRGSSATRSSSRTSSCRRRRRTSTRATRTPPGRL